MMIDNISGFTDLTIMNQKDSSVHSKAEVFDRGDVEKERLMQACKDFESIFVKMMLDSMKKTVDKSDFLPVSQSQEIFEDMLYKSYSEKITETKSFGLAEKIYEQYSSMLVAKTPEQLKEAFR